MRPRRSSVARGVAITGPNPTWPLPSPSAFAETSPFPGYPQDWFIPLPNSARSTVEEASVMLAELDRRHIHRFLLVTSNFHSRRAARIYRRVASPSSFRVVAASHPDFSPGGWWHSRAGKRECLIEWIKTVADWFGI